MCIKYGYSASNVAWLTVHWAVVAICHMSIINDLATNAPSKTNGRILHRKSQSWSILNATQGTVAVLPTNNSASIAETPIFYQTLNLNFDEEHFCIWAQIDFPLPPTYVDNHALHMNIAPSMIDVQKLDLPLAPQSTFKTTKESLREMRLEKARNAYHLRRQRNCQREAYLKTNIAILRNENKNMRSQLKSMQQTMNKMKNKLQNNLCNST
jgi:hypothetical protein